MDARAIRRDLAHFQSGATPSRRSQHRSPELHLNKPGFRGTVPGLTAVLHACKTALVPKSHPRVLTVSRKELLVLDLLVANKQLYGLQLVAASSGQLKRGTVYVTLGRMEDKGYIEWTLEEPPPGAGGLPRRIYAPTPLGRRMLRTWSSGAEQLVPEFAR